MKLLVALMLVSIVLMTRQGAGPLRRYWGFVLVSMGTLCWAGTLVMAEMLRAMRGFSSGRRTRTLTAYMIAAAVPTKMVSPKGGLAGCTH